VATYPGIQEGVGLQSINDVPLSPSGERSLELAGLSQTIELGFRSTIGQASSWRERTEASSESIDVALNERVSVDGYNFAGKAGVALTFDASGDSPEGQIVFFGCRTQISKGSDSFCRQATKERGLGRGTSVLAP
jgi:hypothetical protein